MKRFSIILLSLLLVSTLSLNASAQQQEVHKKSGPRRQLATIIFAGIGGAILGLSTLSFYGRPQDQLANIAIGFAVGVIIGTTYVTFKSATVRDYYNEPDNKNGNGGALSLPSSRFLLAAEDGRFDENLLTTASNSEEFSLTFAPLLQKINSVYDRVGGYLVPGTVGAAAGIAGVATNGLALGGQLIVTF